MTPELKMAQLLSSEEEKQKLATEMEELSVEELEGVLKEANGDMLQYFQDHPEKLKEKQERDAKKEKRAQEKEDLDPATEKRITALAKKMREESAEKVAFADSLGRELAQKEKTAGDLLPFKRPGMASKAVKAVKKGAEKAGKFAKDVGKTVKENRGTFGLMAGTHLGLAAGREDLKAEKEKHKKHIKRLKEKTAVSFNQMNEGSKMLGRLSRLAEKHGPAVKQFAGKVGTGAKNAVTGAASHLSNIKDPVARGAAIGAATGGVGGAVQGFLDPKENPVTGEKQRLRTAFRKGLAGAAAGAPTGALFGAMNKSSSVQRLEAAMEKKALNMAGVGSMAKNFVGQMKPVAQKAMAAAKPMATNAMAKAAPMAQKALGNKTMGQAAGAGAAIGAGLGAAKGLVAPGRDANGQQKSRLGAMARGAAGGAALGAGAGAGAKAALPSMVNAYKKVTPGLGAAGTQLKLGL